MAMPRHHIGVQGDMCQCGRRRSLLHCVECGAAQIRTRHNAVHKMANGEGKIVERQHVCNACGIKFLPEERDWCNATPIGAASAAQKMRILAEAEGDPNVNQDAAHTAKRLLESLKSLNAPSPDEAKAMRVLEQRAVITEEERYKEFRILECTIIGEYREEVNKLRSQGQEHPRTEEEYVDVVLTQMGRERVPKPASQGGNADEGN